MAIAASLVGARGATTSNTVSTTGGSVTTGDTLVAVVSFDPGTTISSISDTAGNSYGTAKVSRTGSGSLACYVVQNATGHASNVLTVNFSGTAYPVAHLIKVTGAATASYDSGSLVEASPTTAPPNSVTTPTLAQAASLIITATEMNANGGTGTYSSSTATILSQEDDATQYWTSAVGYEIVASTSGVTETWSKGGETSPGGARAIFAFALKEAAAGSVTGTGAITLGPVTVAGTGERTVTGTGAITLGPVAVSGSGGGPVAGTGSITLGPIAVAGTGERSITGTGAVTLGPIAVAGTGERSVTGTSAITLGPITVSGTGTAASLPGHGFAYDFVGAGGSSITTSSFTSQSSGSAILVSVGRGVLSDFSTATVSDSKSNSYSQLTVTGGTSHAYTDWPTSGTACYADLTATGGTSHTVTTSKPTTSDEVTIFAVEVPEVNTIVDSAWNQNSSGPSTTSSSVTVSGPAKLVAFWWGDDVNGELGPPAASSGWTAVDYTSSLASNHVQGCSFYREVTAGTYSITVTPNTSQGGQLYIFALQQVETGTGAITLGPVAVAGTGERTVTGTGSVTLGPIAVAGVAERSVAGTGAVTLGPIVVSGSGSVGGALTGSGDITLGPVAVAGTGERSVTGTGAITLGAVTVSGTGERTVTGSGAITLGPVVVAGSGATGGVSAGTGAITLGPVNVEGVGERAVIGAGAITLGAATVSGNGAVARDATGAITLGAIQVAGEGLRITEVTGTGAITLGAIQVHAEVPSGRRGGGSPRRRPWIKYGEYKRPKLNAQIEEILDAVGAEMLYEEVVESAPKAVVAEAKNIVKSYSDNRKVADRVDWNALENDAKRVRKLIELWRHEQLRIQRRKRQAEEEWFLLGD